MPASHSVCSGPATGRSVTVCSQDAHNFSANHTFGSCGKLYHSGTIRNRKDKYNKNKIERERERNGIAMKLRILLKDKAKLSLSLSCFFWIFRDCKFIIKRKKTLLKTMKDQLVYGVPGLLVALDMWREFNDLPGSRAIPRSTASCTALMPMPSLFRPPSRLPPPASFGPADPCSFGGLEHGRLA